MRYPWEHFQPIDQTEPTPQHRLSCLPPSDRPFSAKKNILAELRRLFLMIREIIGHLLSISRNKIYDVLIMQMLLLYNGFFLHSLGRVSNILLGTSPHKSKRELFVENVEYVQVLVMKLIRFNHHMRHCYMSGF